MAGVRQERQWLPEDDTTALSTGFLTVSAGGYNMRLLNGGGRIMREAKYVCLGCGHEVTARPVPQLPKGPGGDLRRVRQPNSRRVRTLVTAFYESGVREATAMADKEIIIYSTPT